MNDANVSVYASTIHCRPESCAPSLCWIVGRATFTTRLSSTGMKSPKTIATRNHQRRRSSELPVTDVDGNTLLDFSGGLGCQLVGYSHPKVVEAVQRQAARFSHTDFSVIPYETYVELGERLVGAVAGGDRKVAFFNSGAEAIENAVKFARAATGRPALLCFEGGFHGRTLLTMTLTSRHHPYKAGFGPFAPEVYRLPYPYPYRSSHPDEAGQLALQAIERAFVTLVDPASVAAVIVEPIQGEGGFV